MGRGPFEHGGDVLLGPGEERRRTEHAVPFRVGEGSGRGSLYLTNVRLVLESMPSGRLASGAPSTVLEVPLDQVRNAAVGSALGRRRYLSVEAGSPGLRLDVVDPGAWVKAIAEAKASLPAPRPSGTVVTHTIERHVVKIRCRHCGSLSEESRDRCPNCGAAL